MINLDKHWENKKYMSEQKYIALIDCDSFFVSCERKLNPRLNAKPVCVVSGSRGCVIARCKGDCADFLSISDGICHRYRNYKHWQLSGFTPKQREWLYPKDEEFEKLATPLAELWKRANLK